MKKIAFFIVLVQSVLHAQNNEQKWQMNAGMNGVIYRFPIDIPDNATDFDRMNTGFPMNYFTLSRHLFAGFSPELKFSAMKATPDPLLNASKNLLATGIFNIKYSLENGYLLSQRSVIEPYFKGGIGLTYLDQPGNKFFTTQTYGGGLAFWFGGQKNFGIQVQQLYHKIPSTAYNAADYFEYSATLGYKFGMKDKDRDGVIDNKDSCADVKGLKSMFGCPDKDGDGIPDHKDRCPDDAGLAVFNGCPDKDFDSIPDIDDKCPEVKGKIFLYGCPDKDGDSIPDYQDSCPSIKGLRMYKGCPDKDGDKVEDRFDKCPDVAGLPRLQGCPDKDGDGITDKEDACPDEYGPKSNRGCPENKDSLDSQLSFRAKSIFFNTNKHDILANSYAILDEIVEIIQNNPREVFVIEGHTDVTGLEGKNLTLSKNRANAVKEYLISKGISRGSLEAEGFGMKYPIADNNSPTNRAKNRRVDITVKR